MQAGKRIGGNIICRIGNRITKRVNNKLWGEIVGGIVYAGPWVEFIAIDRELRRISLMTSFGKTPPDQNS